MSDLATKFYKFMDLCILFDVFCTLKCSGLRDITKIVKTFLSTLGLDRSVIMSTIPLVNISRFMKSSLYSCFAATQFAIPSFNGTSFAQHPFPPNRPTSSQLNISLVLRVDGDNGLIFYADSSVANKDYLFLTVKDRRLELRYSLGKSSNILVINILAVSCLRGQILIRI